ncbi:hypothetical protein J5X75_14215 [Actinoplanes sp. NEAU-H7]|uniref:CorA-like Mg2+ transporter protein n=1 Tax=Actinoplanes flavus TaxID=2820290 RepID=A0ABS3ULS7_9ACTN|nr:CATRA conflict system CASPASE/TPR repeat-associated protein [Actinoplanes flavus]MBO3738678.1 hypothetical protein [Actinoplanes flavus]
MRPHRPGLIQHTFLPADPMPEDAVGSLWEAAAALGMDQPIGRWPIDPPGPGRPPPARPFTVLAGRQRHQPGALHQAILYRLDDVLGVSVLLAPNDDRIGWDRLDGRLPAPPDGAIGTVAIRTALLALPRPWLRPALIARRLGVHPDWAGAWCRTDGGVLTWELPSGTWTRRHLLAVTGIRNEPAMDEWTWAGDRSGLPPLTRYLLHAAKLRYQRQVLESSMPSLRRAIVRADEGFRVLDQLLSTGEPPLAQLLAADRALTTAQADQSGLITALGDVRDMARTVHIADRNMTAALAGHVPGAPAGPPALDREHATWLREQLRAEETYLESAHHRTREISRLAAAVIDQRQRQRQENLTLLQTSALGALLMALAAIQSLTYRIPLPGPLFAPVIAFLAAIALLLPSALLRWPGGPNATRRRWPVPAGAALLGVTAGWLSGTVGWILATGHGAPPTWSAIYSAATGVVFAAVALAGGRRAAA